MIKIAPSILSADFSKLGEDVKLISDAGCDYIHIDIMDGSFVPNISFGAMVTKSIRNITDKIFDVHLMIDDPDKYAKDFVDAGADIITVHAESTIHLHRTIQYVKSLGVKVGVALNPGTPLEVIEYVLEDIDMVLIMTVNPGFGGQSFIDAMYEKIEKINRIKKEKSLGFDIQVDGGIGLNNLKKVVDAGANIIVAGSSIYKSDDVAKTIAKFKEVC